MEQNSPASAAAIWWWQMELNTVWVGPAVHRHLRFVPECYQLCRWILTLHCMPCDIQDVEMEDLDVGVRVLEKADVARQESLQSEVIPDPMEGEQTWPTEEELAEAEGTTPILYKQHRSCISGLTKWFDWWSHSTKVQRFEIRRTWWREWFLIT